MNPFKTLATALATFLVDFRAKMNPVLASLPPLESIEASDPVLCVIRTAKWAMKDAEDMAASFDGKVSQVEDMLSKFAKDSGEAAITAAIEEKKIVLIADHDSALTAARETAKAEGRTEAEVEFTAKLQAVQLLATRRTDAVTRLGSLAAAKITDEALLADDFETTLTAVEGRLATLKEKNITAELQPKVYESLVAHVQNEASFTSTLEVMLEAAGGAFAAAAPSTPAPPKPSQRTGAPLDAAGEKKARVI